MNEEKSLTGRIIVFAIFAAVAGYLSIAVFGSIINELYAKPPVNGAAELTLADRTWCVRALVGLRDEIEGQVALELQHPRREGDPFARWRTWQVGWLGKLGGARSKCTAGDQSLDDAFQSLQALHDGYQDGIDRMIHTRSDVAQKLKESLRLLRAPEVDSPPAP